MTIGEPNEVPSDDDTDNRSGNRASICGHSSAKDVLVLVIVLVIVLIILE